MWQQILVYGLLAFAIVFLVRKYFFQSKKKKSNWDKDCHC